MLRVSGKRRCCVLTKHPHQIVSFVQGVGAIGIIHYNNTICIHNRRVKWPVYIFAFGEYNSKQVNVSGMQIFRAQFLALHLRKVILNAVNIYLFGIIHTKCKCIYRSFILSQPTSSDHLRFLSKLACQKTVMKNLFMKNLSRLRPPGERIMFNH